MRWAAWCPPNRRSSLQSVIRQKSEIHRKRASDSGCFMGHYVVSLSFCALRRFIQRPHQFRIA